MTLTRFRGTGKYHCVSASMPQLLFNFMSSSAEDCNYLSLALFQDILLPCSQILQRLMQLNVLMLQEWVVPWLLGYLCYFYMILGAVCGWLLWG